MKDNTQKAIFAAGCFWGVEEAFNRLAGVINTRVGYAGGITPNPTYEQVCSSETGHAETVEVTFDPKHISYNDLLQKFFVIHDPTLSNRQGADIGSQYRSAIFYTDDHQKELANKMVYKMQNSGLIDKPIVTEINKLTYFYPAEEYHQKYYLKHKNFTC